MSHTITHTTTHQMLARSEDPFCLQVKVQKENKKTQKLPNTTHLLTNIAYRLKPHHTRNKYLRARIDTGAEVNFMLVSVYRLIHQDQDLKKLTPCNLKIGTYMADTIRIIATTIIYLIHPDSKQPNRNDLPCSFQQRQCTFILKHFTAPQSHTL